MQLLRHPGSQPLTEPMAKPKKPQQQTLSVRISDTMRRRLERARELESAKTGAFVSTSEIAKQLLETVQEERLEFVDLIGEGPKGLLRIRHKAEAGHPLSRAEWTVVGHFVQQGLEGVFGATPITVSRESLVAVVDAFAAVYDLPGRSSPLDDGFYLLNVPEECRPVRPRRGYVHEVSPDIVRRTVAEVRRRLADPADPVWPVFMGRNLYRVIELTKVGPDALTAALRPWWPILWRLVARGQYFLMRTPLRDPERRSDGLHDPPIPSLDEEPFSLVFARGEFHDFSAMLVFPGHGPMYPFGSYPVLAEFRTLLAAVPSSRAKKAWKGRLLFGYTTVPTATEPGVVWFRAQDNGITIGFSDEEWAAVQRLFRRAWQLPAIQQLWDALALEYGELP